MTVNIITKGLELTSVSIPVEWNESANIQLEEKSITITFSGGTIGVSEGNSTDAAAEIQLTEKKLCDYIDGSTDYMTVWRELAEPSPSDRTIIRKGSGAKVFLLIDKLCHCYKREKQFRKLLDDYKTKL
jgi:hypothetical protein